MENQNFTDWFGASVITKDGRPGGTPLVVYHGSNQTFSEFRPGEDGGFHFAVDPEQAVHRALTGGMIYPVYLKAEKILRVKDRGSFSRRQIQQWKRQGYDGIVYLNRYEGMRLESVKTAFDAGVHGDALDNLSDEQFKKHFPEARDSYIVFSASQIRSIFDPEFFESHNRKMMKPSEYSKAIDPDGNWMFFQNIGDDEYVLLYHATSKENAENILKNGFQQQLRKTWSDTPAGYVYMGSVFEGFGLGTYLGPHTGKQPTIVAVRVQKKFIEPDLGSDWKSYLRNPENKAFMKRHNIDWKNPTAVTTYSQINQVRAPMDRVEPVGIYDPETGQIALHDQDTERHRGRRRSARGPCA